MKFTTSLFSIALLLAPAFAQYATDCGASTQITFNQCVSNGITDGTGQPAPAGTSVEAACAGVQNNQAVYFCCLCKGFQSVLGCYNSFCAASGTLTSIQQSQQQYCGACQPTSATSAARPSTTLAFPSAIPGGPTQAPASSTAGPQATNAAGNSNGASTNAKAAQFAGVVAGMVGVGAILA